MASAFARAEKDPVCKNLELTPIALEGAGRVLAVVMGRGISGGDESSPGSITRISTSAVPFRVISSLWAAV
jgi:hypothetical protein